MPNEEQVFRAARRSRDVDKRKKEFNASAFMLRPADPEKQKEAETDLSVDLARLRNAQKVADSLKKCYGVCELNVGEIRGVSSNGRIIDVVHRPIAKGPEPNCAHCEVTGLPMATEDPYVKERFADALQEISTWVDV